VLEAGCEVTEDRRFVRDPQTTDGLGFSKDLLGGVGCVLELA
jgi:hypothetical protein